MNCSDKHLAWVCSQCGSMLSPAAAKPGTGSSSGLGFAHSGSKRVECRTCDGGGQCDQVAMPYVFRYLANELAAMNIRLSLSMKE